ncbi:MAG: electron transfer flavoprotein subunit alpha/FixB family protein [Thermodesulfobacteriota bacterium]
MTLRGGILVVGEARERGLDPGFLALLGEGRAWSRSFDPPLPVLALVFGEVERAGAVLGPYGTAEVYVCPLPDRDYAPEAAARAVARLAHQLEAAWIFFSHDAWGQVLAPWVSFLLEAGLAGRCLGLERNSRDGYVSWQPVHESRLFRRVGLPDKGVKVVSWEPGALGRHQPEDGAEARVIALSPPASPDQARVRPLRRKKGDPRTLPLAESDRIVAVGRGLIPQGLPLVEELAKRLEAGLGGTRPVIDLDLLPYERQIGQTGASVAPSLLVTCGVSGANEFTVGITDSQNIVAINKDRQARIFALADLGLVGDGFEIITEFLAITRPRPKDESGPGQQSGAGA